MNQYKKVFDIQSEIIAGMSEETGKTKEEIWQIYLENSGVQNLVRKILSEKRRAKPNEELELAYKNKIFVILEAEQNAITTK